MDKSRKIKIDDFFQPKGSISNYSILVDGDEIYKVILNFSSLKNNNNKFYNLEIIYNKTSNNYILYKRYGRNGVDGQIGNEIFKDKVKAINKFNKTLAEKNKKNYRKIDVNIYEGEEPKKKDDNQNNDDDNEDFEDDLQNFDDSLKNLIKMIFDKSALTKDLKNLGFNTNELPLGQLTEDALNKGFEILKGLNKLLDKKKDKKIKDQIFDLNDDFFSFIPHVLERRGIIDNLIDSKDKVQEKNLMWVSLKNLKNTDKVLKSHSTYSKLYESLSTKITTIEHSEELYKILEQGLYNTHCKTHYFKMKVLNIYEIDKDEDYKSDIGNKTLLWHGSRISNFVGILKKSLMIAPPEAPVSGYMFGKGVYFADLSSKSGQYTRYGLNEQNIGLLLLCECKIGNPKVRYHADYNANNLENGFHCTWGNGRNIPGDFVDIKGARFYNNNIINNPDSKGTLYYNEYIIYNTSQIKMKYLFEIKFS